MTNQDIEITSFNLNGSDDWPCTIYESDNSKRITNDQYVLYENCYSVYKVKIGYVSKWVHLDFLLNDDINLNSVSQHIDLSAVQPGIEDNEDTLYTLDNDGIYLKKIENEEESTLELYFYITFKYNKGAFCLNFQSDDQSITYPDILVNFVNLPSIIKTRFYKDIGVNDNVFNLSSTDQPIRVDVLTANGTNNEFYNDYLSANRLYTNSEPNYYIQYTAFMPNELFDLGYTFEIQSCYMSDNQLEHNENYENSISYTHTVPVYEIPYMSANNGIKNISGAMTEIEINFSKKDQGIPDNELLSLNNVVLDLKVKLLNS